MKRIRELKSKANGKIKIELRKLEKSQLRKNQNKV